MNTNKKLRNILFFVIFLLFVAYLAENKFHFLASRGSVPTSLPKQAVPLYVKAMVVKPKAFDEKLTVTGTLIAYEQIDIISEVSGKIQRILFKEGDWVKKGQLLIQLDVSYLEAQLEKLHFSKKLYETNEFRQRKLLEKEAISQEEYDIAITQLNTTNADIKVLENQIQKSFLKAAFSGYIGLRMVSEGAFITSNTDISTLTNKDSIKIEFSIPGKYSHLAKKGKKIFFSSDISKRSYEGIIYAVSSVVDQATRTLKVRGIVPNKDNDLFPGQFTTVDIVLEHKENAILIPTESIVNDINGNKIFLSKNNIAVEQVVTMGTRTSTEVEILDGVNTQDTLIISGLLQIKNGTSLYISDFIQ